MSPCSGSLALRTVALILTSRCDKILQNQKKTANAKNIKLSEKCRKSWILNSIYVWIGKHYGKLILVSAEHIFPSVK